MREIQTEDISLHEPVPHDDTKGDFWYDILLLGNKFLATDRVLFSWHFLVPHCPKDPELNEPGMRASIRQWMHWTKQPLSLSLLLDLDLMA